MNKPGFWRWLWNGLKASTELELAMGIIVFAGLSVFLGIIVSPWWLLVTMPVGILLILHAFYRESQGGF